MLAEKKHIHMLLIEDDAGDTLLLEEIVGECSDSDVSFEMITVTCLGNGLSFLSEEGACDLIVMDLGLPDSTGVDSLTKILPSANNVPIIVLTGLQDENVALQAVQNGAQDYLVKGMIDAQIFRRAAIYAIERKQVEAKLAQMAREWETTFNTTSDVIFLLDKESRIVRANKIAEQMFGYEPGQMLGRYCWETVHNTEFPISSCPNVKSKQSLVRETIELQIGENWYRVAVDPILDSSRNYAGSVHVITDITEQKTATEKLKLSEEKLRQEKENLEKALAEIKQLSGLIPICSSCKKIRDDEGYWEKLEGYIERHSEAVFSHSICDDCTEALYGNDQWYQKMKQKKESDPK